MASEDPEQTHVERALGRAERTMYARCALGCVLFCTFALLNISAALTGQLHDEAPWLLALLIGAILALPRRPLPTRLLEEIEGQARRRWQARQVRLKKWLASARVVFFVCALFLMLGLPELV